MHRVGNPRLQTKPAPLPCPASAPAWRFISRRCCPSSCWYCTQGSAPATAPSAVTAASVTLAPRSLSACFCSCPPASSPALPSTIMASSSGWTMPTSVPTPKGGAAAAAWSDSAPRRSSLVNRASALQVQDRCSRGHRPQHNPQDMRRLASCLRRCQLADKTCRRSAAWLHPPGPPVQLDVGHIEQEVNLDVLVCRQAEGRRAGRCAGGRAQ